MITDHLTNTVFLSDWFSKECPELYQSLTKTLRDNALDCRILSNTNDIWCRDYMPIQTDEKRFVSYKYYPDYLVNHLYLQTDRSMPAYRFYQKNGFTDLEEHASLFKMF